MARISSRELREKFVGPISELALNLSKAASTLEGLEQREEIPYLPANFKTALGQLKDLLAWYELEIKGKLEGAADGTGKFAQALRNERKKDERQTAKKKS